MVLFVVHVASAKTRRSILKQELFIFHLFLSGFMPSYNCWTSHGELDVRMEEDEIEDENIPEWDHCGGFEKYTTEDTGEGFEDNVVADDLDQIIQDVQED